MRMIRVEYWDIFEPNAGEIKTISYEEVNDLNIYI